MKTHLITGVTGMVGSHLLDYILKETNDNVIGMLRWRSPLENINHHLHLTRDKKGRFKIVYGDLNDYSSLENIFKKNKPDFIYHLAAQSYPQTSFTSPLDTLNTNIIGTANLLEVIKGCKSAKYDPVIHVCSSSEVFGRVPKERIPICEDELFHPASPYAISKAGTDLLGRYYGEAYGLRTVTTRMFTHTGPRRGDVFAESSFAKQIALVELGLIEPVIRVGNLDSLRTFADVRDAVNAYYMLVNNSPKPGSYYNIGGLYTCTIGEMLNKLISLSTMKKEIKIQTDKDRLRPIDADLQVPNVEKFKKFTGWEPKYKFHTTMKDLLNYWRNKLKDENNFLVR